MHLKPRYLGALVGALGLVTPLVTAAATQTASAASGASSWKHESNCKIQPRPRDGFIEAGLGSTHSSVAFVLLVECRPVFSEQTVEISTPQLNNACHNTLSWFSPTGRRGGPSVGRGEAFNVFLDDDGNATAVVWGGPSCAASEDLVTADLVTSPYSTAKTTVQILPPRTTRESLHSFPPAEVEDSISSSVDAIFYAEFPGSYGEQKVEFSDAQLFDRCAGHIYWIGADERILARNTKSATTTLDDNGNAFVVALAGPSCAAGPTTAQVDIVNATYTSLWTKFYVATPRPTNS
jgi:hypothetical protein